MYNDGNEGRVDSCYWLDFTYTSTSTLMYFHSLEAAQQAFLC